MQMARACAVDATPRLRQAFAMSHAMPHAAILILAAGQSSRMRGADKMLESVEGQPLIRRQSQVALATGLPVWVTLPPDRPWRLAALQNLPLTVIKVADADQGLSRSIKAGNAAVPAGLSLILWLADLPEITKDDLLQLARAAQAAPDAIIRATTAAGKPGHPVVFASKFRAKLNTLAGDDGARDILRQHMSETIFVPLPGNRALTDLDTPEDWANWRASQML